MSILQFRARVHGNATIAIYAILQRFNLWRIDVNIYSYMINIIYESVYAISTKLVHRLSGWRSKTANAHMRVGSFMLTTAWHRFLE